MADIDWAKYHPYFTKPEFACRETGECNMSPEFLDRLLALRLAYGKGMVISSGFRGAKHSKEISKPQPGPHNTGQAADILVYGDRYLALLKLAQEHGFTGIGANQKGDYKGRFLHLDDLPNTAQFQRPWGWTY